MSGNFVTGGPESAAAEMDKTARAARTRVLAVRQGVLDNDVKGKPAHLSAARYSRPFNFAHVSRKPTVRLNTGRPGRDSASGVK